MNTPALIHALRYQILRPSITTMGPCPKCAAGSRGSDVCSACLMVSLTDVIGPDKADGVYFAAVAAQEALLHLDAMTREAMA